MPSAKSLLENQQLCVFLKPCFDTIQTVLTFDLRAMSGLILAKTSAAVNMLSCYSQA